MSRGVEMSQGGHESASEQRVVQRLKLYFAVLACLGGLVLSVGSQNETIPVVAIFFAVVGYLFVDRWQLFALPPVVAYLAMALAALYCVSRFIDLDQPGNHQMDSVAQLLVFVQAILMLQQKTRRIFEQLGVFCLLELIVAAVFNHAIEYGLLLIPIGIVGALALSGLAMLSASDGLLSTLDVRQRFATVGGRRGQQSVGMTVAAPMAVESLVGQWRQIPKLAILTLTPAVLLVAVVFFYALPRVTDAANVQGSGQALVGFSDDVRLGQIGQMMQSTQVALRVYLTNRNTGRPYRINGGMYLRGRVLGVYSAQGSGRNTSAQWSETQRSEATIYRDLPLEFLPTRSTDRNFYDPVKVSVVCESTRSPALFALAPYYRVRRNRDILHYEDRWTILRDAQQQLVYPRKVYQFGTNAFRLGVQTDMLARRSMELRQVDESLSDAQRNRILTQQFQMEKRARQYEQTLSIYDQDRIPSAKTLAEQLIREQIPEPNEYRIAKTFERYLATSPTFEYTLNLNSEPIPGMDPIEQFLSVDRRGNCQYFASALAMMLRSQDIPARIVVGYLTEEFNELGGHYVARQSHAHAWVEALINGEQLSERRMVYGQPNTPQYWLRLDPTPSSGRIRQGNSEGVVQVFDMAQNIWNDYVVDMDASHQNSTLAGGGIGSMNDSYTRLVQWVSLTISRVRAGELGGGSFATGQFFSLPAAILGGLVAVVFALVLRVRVPRWISHRRRSRKGLDVGTPSIDFYAETLRQLERLGIKRKPSQTPAELVTEAVGKLQHPMLPSLREPLAVLTESFYRVRFRSEDPGPGDSKVSGIRDSVSKRQRAREVRKRESSNDSKNVSANIPEVRNALRELTAAIDQIIQQSQTTGSFS